MTIHPDTSLFLTTLFSRCTSGYLTLTALPPDDGVARSTPSRHIRLTDNQGLTDALDRLAVSTRLGWGACIGIATRRANLGRYHRGTRRDLCRIPALFVDIDHSEADTEARLHDFPLKPSIQVNSGHGQHLYFLLDRPTTDFQAVDQILRGLAHWLGGDVVMTSVNSLRLPGTVNTKKERQMAFCHLIQCDPGQIYPLSELAPYRILPAPLTERAARPLPFDKRSWTAAEYNTLARQVEQRLLRDYGGFWRRNGWLSAFCPLPHQQDRPGQHFGYSPARKIGHCFGKHGTLALPELCAELRLLYNGNKLGT